MDLHQVIQTIAVNALPVLFAITIHEAAHGYAARHFGDNTAWVEGRVSLNPMKHIDPVGTVAMPLVLYLLTSGSFLFGYAKPVPVNFGRLRNPKRDMVWVALAGPASNFVQAALWGALLLLLHAFGVHERFFLGMCLAGINTNLVMFAFNLFPLPPLDGGRVLVGLLPWKAAVAVSRVEPWGFYIVMALVIGGWIGGLWLRPLMGLAAVIIDVLLWPLRGLLGG